MFYTWYAILNNRPSSHPGYMSDMKLCTHSLLREYYVKNGYFPSGGVWRNYNKTAFFKPSDCYLKHPWISQTLISKCLISSNVSSIATLGDSNGKLNFEALTSLIGGQESTCQLQKEERKINRGFLADKNYFNTGNNSWSKYVEAKRRLCRTCASKAVTCHVTDSGKSRDIAVEHVTLMHLIDTSIRIQTNKSELSAPTTQEFYLKHYFTNRYPDVIIIFPPFNHMKFSSTSQNRRELKQFKFLVDKYVPSSTKIFYIPTFSEFENRRKDKTYFNKKYHGALAVPKILWLNHKLFQILERDLMNESSNIYGFFDMFSISKSRESWSTDGVHMISTWYQNEMSMFLDLFCNSVFKKSF
jgi:hypothetical protein